MKTSTLCLKSIIRESKQSNDIPDMNLNELRNYLQSWFPRYDIDELLCYSELITPKNQIDPILFHEGFIKTVDHFVESKSALVLDVIITGQGVHAIREILRGYITDAGNVD